MNANDFPAESLSGSQKDSRAFASIRGSDLVRKDEVYQIVGCAMEVLNELGHGLNEKPYEDALVVEFGLRKIPFLQQPRYTVVYKQVTVGEYVPDLVVFGAVVVDTKVIESISDHERGQMLNYLRITGHRVGVILNLKRAKLEWEHRFDQPRINVNELQFQTHQPKPGD
ncbi:MAG: GxxExxY protein [Verrucomicrobia bacterium]|nr:GxxExxY protein [Verrucomicrobiota bacterium]